MNVYDLEEGALDLPPPDLLPVVLGQPPALPCPRLVDPRFPPEEEVEPLLLLIRYPLVI